MYFLMGFPMKYLTFVKLFIAIILFQIFGYIYSEFLIEIIVQEETSNSSYFDRNSRIDESLDHFDLLRLKNEAINNKVILSDNNGYLYPFYPVDPYYYDQLKLGCEKEGWEFVDIINMCLVDYLESQNENKSKAISAPKISGFASTSSRYKYREDNREYWPGKYKGLSIIQLRKQNLEKETIAFKDNSFSSLNWGIEISYNILAQWIWGKNSKFLKSLEKYSRRTLIDHSFIKIEAETIFDYQSGNLIFDEFLSQRERLVINGKDTGIKAYCGTLPLKSEILNKAVLKSNVRDELFFKKSYNDKMYNDSSLAEPEFSNDKQRIRFIERLYESIVNRRNKDYSYLKWSKNKRLIGEFSGIFKPSYKKSSSGNHIGICISKTNM